MVLEQEQRNCMFSEHCTQAVSILSTFLSLTSLFGNVLAPSMELLDSNVLEKGLLKIYSFLFRRVSSKSE